MPEPSKVNPHNFEVVEIVYNLNGFSVAWGKWEDGTYRLAMRWNGEGENKGYPKTFGNPVWFILPRDLSFPMLQFLGLYQWASCASALSPTGEVGKVFGPFCTPDMATHYQKMLGKGV